MNLLRSFAAWLNGEPITKDAAVEYKHHIAATHKATSVNGAVAALKGFFAFMELPIQLKHMKIQRQTYRAREKELSRAEYERLLKAAQKIGNMRLNLVLQTICSTGIRVSELQFITVAAVRRGEGEIIICWTIPAKWSPTPRPRKRYSLFLKCMPRGRASRES